MESSFENGEKKYYGNYRGEVVNVDDSIKNGRCQIRVFGVFDDLSDEVLPWAQYSDPFMGGIEDVGGLLVPNVGAHVWVFFEGGNHMHPVYFAGAPAMNGPDRPDTPSEGRENGTYPNNKVFKTKAGVTIEIDDTEGEVSIRVTHPSGNSYESDNDGNVDATQKGNVKIITDGNVTWDAPKMDFGVPAKLEPSVLGDQLSDWINNILIPWLEEHHHIGNLGAATSPALASYPYPVNRPIEGPGGTLYSKDNRNQ